MRETHETMGIVETNQILETRGTLETLETTETRALVLHGRNALKRMEN